MRLLAVSTFLALALPLAAQAEPAVRQDPSPNEILFYKAFFLEKGERDFAAAMALYQKFLEAEPGHRLARIAAQNNLNLLRRTGRGDEAEAFQQKFASLLGERRGRSPEDRAPRGARTDRPADRPAGERPQDQRARGPLGPEQIKERLKSLEDDLAKAKEAGDEERAARIERQIQRMRDALASGGQGGRSPRGQGGQGRGRGFAPPKFAEMTKEQLEEFKTTRLERMSGMVDRVRERQGDEAAKQLEDAIQEVRSNLDAGKLEEAQKAFDKIMEAMRRRIRGGGGI
ncbi:MAG: hypothetical protein Fur0037_08550 [Planctomycetota bacterium]